MSKNFNDFEIEHGLIFINREKYPENKKITHEEFIEIIEKNPDDFIGIDWKSRKQFLVQNGYDVNHTNMLDGNLSVKRVI